MLSLGCVGNSEEIMWIYRGYSSLTSQLVLIGSFAGILIDLGTPDPTSMNAELADHYDEFIQLVRAKNDKVLDPNSPAQEAYEMPIVETNGKR